ncbi:branched-chain amino acid ABC transporter permease [Halorarius litoreus]|uniref:branched-chain amino acid ABC transporter permease n=1 Tax=Halorarius litoreus TaxID=2962676 RepID=UPI0020CF2F2B|nr:branched-chain amino acid ABC transporter permease [Halorarius litoreus]
MSGAQGVGDRIASVTQPVRDAIERHDALKVAVLLLLVYVLFIALVWNQNPSSRLNSIANTLRLVTFFAAVYALLVLALNLHWGYTGLFNIGVAGFMAVGAYTYAIATRPVEPTISTAPAGLGLPIPVGIVLGMLVASVFGLVAALPALRLRADYFAIVTLGLSEIIRLTIQSSVFDTFLRETFGFGTGGGSGIRLDPGVDSPVRELFYISGSRGEGLTPLGQAIFAITDNLSILGVGGGIRQSVVISWAYVVLLAVFVLAFYWLLRRIGNSPFGRVLKAIREDELVANSLGKNVNLVKIKVFMIGCALMGLGGILWQGSQGSFSPTPQFLPVITFYIFVAMMVGGAGSNTGSVLGAIVFAGLLFEGPRRLGGFIRGQFTTDVNPNTIADALGALVNGDIVPLVVYATDTRIAALQFVLLGVVLVILMQRRPEGLLGHRVEEAAAVDLSKRTSKAAAADGGESGGEGNE